MSRTTHRCAVMGAAICALLITHCEEPATVGRVVRVDSSGVELVLNPGEDHLLAWTFERERVLGGAADGVNSFYQVRQGLVDVDGRGNLYVLDPTNVRVVAFDSVGRVRWTAGQQGGGPREMLGANSLSVSSDGIVYVHDARKGALVRFDSNGRVLPQVAFPFGIIRARAPHFHVLPGGLAVLAREPYQGSDERRVRILRIADQDTAVLFSRNLPLSKTAVYPNCGMTLTLPVLFAAHIRWSQSADQIAVATGPQYEIEVYGPDGLVRGIRRAIEPKAVSRTEALEVLQERSGLGGPLAPCNTSATRVLENHGFAPQLQIVRAVALAANGELWVRRNGGLDGSPGPVDVFDEQGEYVGTLPAEAPFPVVFLPGGRIGFSQADELGVERLVIARVRRTEPGVRGPPARGENR